MSNASQCSITLSGISSSQTSLDSAYSEIYPVQGYFDKFVNAAKDILNPLPQKLEQNLNIKEKLQYYTINEDRTINVPLFIFNLAKSLNIDLSRLDELGSRESELFCRKLEEERERIEKWSMRLRKRAKKSFSLLADGQKKKVCLDMSEAQEKLLNKSQKQEESSLQYKQLEVELQNEKQRSALLEKTVEFNSEKIEWMKNLLKDQESKKVEITIFEQKIQTLHEKLDQEQQKGKQFEEQNKSLVARTIALDQEIISINRIIQDERQRIAGLEEQNRSLLSTKIELNERITDLNLSLTHELQKIEELERKNRSLLSTKISLDETIIDLNLSLTYERQEIKQLEERNIDLFTKGLEQDEKIMSLNSVLEEEKQKVWQLEEERKSTACQNIEFMKQFASNYIQKDEAGRYMTNSYEQLIAKYYAQGYLIKEQEYLLEEEVKLKTTMRMRSNFTAEMQQEWQNVLERKNVFNYFKELKSAHEVQRNLIRQIQKVSIQKQSLMLNNLRATVDSHFSDSKKEMEKEQVTHQQKVEAKLILQKNEEKQNWFAPLYSAASSAKSKTETFNLERTLSLGIQILQFFGSLISIVKSFQETQQLRPS